MRRNSRLLAVTVGLALMASGAVASLTVASPVTAQPPVVFSSDFEDGTTQGWHTRGTTSIQASSAQAHSGDFSLLATDRSAEWHGPAYDMLDILEAGARYEFAAWVRLTEGTPTSNIALTMQYVPASTGETSWHSIAAVQEANSDSWTSLVGEFSPPEPGFELEFYVESGNTTASYYLDDVMVTMIEPPPGDQLPGEESGSVDLDTTLNHFEGFGFSQTFGRAAWMTDLTPQHQQEVLDLLLDPEVGMGLSILRLGIGSAPDGNFRSIQPEDPGGPDAPPQYVWDGWDGGEVWLAQQARDYGVERFYASAWSAPGYMKTNGSNIEGGELCGLPGTSCPDWRQAYADYLLQYVQFYADEGVIITDLGFTNEPDLTVSYDSMRFDDEQMIDFINIMGPAIADSGLDLSLVCCDAAGWDRQVQYTQAIEDSNAAQWVDIHAGHSYVSAARSPLPTDRTTWMSEYALPAGSTWNEAWDAGGANSGLALANDIHDTVTQTGVNAYITWFGASAENTAAPIQLDGSDYHVSKRLWATAAYSRFIRPDSFRVAAGTDGQLLKVSAFRNADGSGVVNLINNRSSDVSFDLSVAGAPPGTGVTTYRTDEQHPLEVVDQSTLGASGLTVDLPARSLTTLVLDGEPGGTEPPPSSAGCTADYQVVGEWQDGFQGEVTVTAGESATSEWQVAWTFADGQSINQHWNALVTTSGAEVIAGNVSWNGNLGPGESARFGFIGTHTGTNPMPALTCTAM